jgi:adenylate cyclase
MFKLLLDEGSGPREVLLPEGDTVFGRAPTCDVLIADPSVSRWHARFRVDGAQCLLADVGSRNGTFLNGEPVTDERPVHDGDEVLLGEFRVSVAETGAPPIRWSDAGLADAAATVYRPVDEAPIVDAQSPETLTRLRKLLGDIAAILLRASSDTDVLDRIVQLALDHLGADRAVLLLPREGSGDLVPRVIRAKEGAEAYTVSRSVVSRVMRDRVAILASDLGDSVLQSESIARQHVRSFICSPLWQEQSVSGALYVDTPLSRHFTAQDVEVLISFANYAAIALEQVRLLATLREETRRRERLQRYHSPAVVERILQDPGAAATNVDPQEREATVLFADLVGFTSLAEQLPPAAVGRLLNESLSLLTDAVFEEEGTLDKYLGDAILGVFGAPFPQSDHATRAVRAARRMRRRLAERNARSDVPLQVRIGISSGLVLAGDIGSMKRREYTVLGDVVNTAARLQSSVAYPDEIVITAATLQQLADDVTVRSRGLVTLRGRQRQVEVFAVDD